MPPRLSLVAFAAPALLGAAPPPEPADGQVTTMTFHERIIIRVPRLDGPPIRALQPTAWKEHRGPRCIAASELAGALVTQADIVDLVLAGNRRVRARLDGRCEPLDFYSGFYLKPAADGKVCAARDAIRARSGATCRIETFRSLKPVVARAGAAR